MDSTSQQAGTPPQYRLSEVGVVPADWAVDSLQAALLSTPSYGINAAAVGYDENLPTYIRITDIDEEGRFRSSPRVSVAHAEASRFFLGPNDLVFARTGASVGKSYLYDERDGPLVFAGFLIRVTPDPQQLLPGFLAYYAQSRRYWDWVASSSVRSGQPGINAQQYGKLLLPLPTLGEQRAIAEALSDVDELLRSLDALVAKKQAIKQAAIQQLLTGRTRLPGFSGTWKIKRLADLGATYGGLTGKSRADFVGGDARYVTFLNVLNNVALDPHGVGTVRVAPAESQNRVQMGDLLFNGTSETPGDLAMAAVVGFEEPELYLNSFCFGFRPHDKEEYSPLFIAHFFRASPGRQIMYALAQGATRYNMSKSQFMALSLPLPPCDEQLAIAKVLSDMDAEIAAFERRREKTHAIKLGMMQQLLTGRIRLVEPTTVSEASA